MSTFESEVTSVPAGYDVESLDQTKQQNKVSWGAIFAGVVVALVVQALLTMLGVGIGIATLDAGSSNNPDGSTFSIAAGIWYVLAGIIAAFAGGYISARMSGKILPTTGALHGLTTWALTTLLVMYFLTSSVGALVGGVFSGVASALGGAGQTIAQTAAPLLANSDPLTAIKSQIQATGTDPAALNAAAINAMKSLVSGDPATAEAARAQAAQALAAARGFHWSRPLSRSRIWRSNITQSSTVRSSKPLTPPMPLPQSYQLALSLLSWLLCWAQSLAGLAAGLASSIQYTLTALSRAREGS